MLQLLRKYQRFFYLIITVVIVLSFSFFGTWKAANTGDVSDPVAFEAVDGSKVTRLQLEEFTYFISSDVSDAFAQGSGWGGNILNDGVVREDILESGIGAKLVEQYFDEFQNDFSSRFDREKHFKPYAHPQAPFLSAEAAWSHFMPELKSAYDTFMTSDHKTKEGMRTRIDLYLAEKKFPAGALRQVLHYQQQNLEQVAPDQRLYQEDLSLFGHHTMEDWFGRRFSQLIAEFIINCAKVAQEKGYVVTLEEAQADLARNAEMAFRYSRQFGDVGAKSSGAYMDQMLQRLRMDSVRAAKVWQQVLLFRRLFNDVGGATLVDRLSYEKFSEYANEAVEVDIYQLPQMLRFADARSLQKFEVYLDAVADDNRSALSLPATFSSVEEVKARVPELVQQSYKLSFTEADINLLQTQVSVKESWAWQVEADNFSELQKVFSELGGVKASTEDERFQAIEKLDSPTRAKVDVYARAAILKANPQWVDDALNNEATTATVFIREKGSIMPFKGISDTVALMKVLDSVPLESCGSGPLFKYTQDKQHYYRIAVLERGQPEEIISFAQASSDGTLDALLDARLEKHWQSIRGEDRQFRASSGQYKPFNSVKAAVADNLFSSLYRAISQDYERATGMTAPLTSDSLAARRFHSYMRGVKQAMERDQSVAEAFVASESHRSLADQWKLIKVERTVERSKAEPAAFGQAFSLQENQWSKVISPAHGDLSFFKVQKRGSVADPEAVSKKMDEARALLGAEAKRALTEQLLSLIDHKGAIVLPDTAGY